MIGTVYTCCEPDCGLPSKSGKKGGWCQHHINLHIGALLVAQLEDYKAQVTGGPTIPIDDIVSAQQMTARPVGPDGKPLWGVVYVGKWRWRWMTLKARVTWWLWRRSGCARCVHRARTTWCRCVRCRRA